MSTHEKVQKLISNSGNNLHSKVAKWFSDNDWHISISPYYMDQSTNKAREIDLLVERRWLFNDGWGHSTCEVAIRLFVECKYIPRVSVFWFADKDMEAAKDIVCSMHPFRADNMYTDKHHYLSTSTKVAKLFASSKDKSTENEPFYKALNQSLNAMVSLHNKAIGALSRADQKRGRYPETTLVMPLVVCNSFDQLYGVDFYGKSDPWQIIEPFQLEVDYAYQDMSGAHRNNHFLLDIVSLNHLEKYCSDLEEDARAAAHLLP